MRYLYGKEKWIVKTEEKDYEIQLVSSNKVTINGEEYVLSQFKSNSFLGLLSEYKLPIDDANIILSYSVSKYILVVDGKNYDTGKEYVLISNMPKITYIFIVLHAINFINGAVGICFACLGVSLTLKINCSKMPFIVKIILNILNLLGMIGFVFLLAILLNLLLY